MQDCWDHVYRSTTAAKYRISGFRDVVFVLVGILTLFGYRANGSYRVINDGRSYGTLVNLVMLVTQCSLKSCPEATASITGPSLLLCCKISEGVISDSE
jgi:hypothetical protein